ncbi:hypothetical protein CVT25_014994, partial [Psilocybe cyanescens]
ISLFVPKILPATKPDHYRVLSSRAGVHFSPLQLGAMNIGDKWEAIDVGGMDKESSFKLLDAYYDNGGNFINTANREWTEKRGICDQLFIATTVDIFSTCWKDRNDSVQQKVMYTGNSVKSLYISVQASLKKLRTDIEEVMQSLHGLVLQRKVLYLVRGLGLVCKNSRITFGFAGYL